MATRALPSYQRPALQANRPHQAAIALVALTIALLAASLIVQHPQWSRPLFAAAIAGNLLLVAGKWPRGAIVLTLVYLPFMGLLRRLLIAPAGWASDDPLLLVAPLVALALLCQLFIVERRVIALDRLSKLILALLFLALFQAFNPLAGSPVGGIVGLLFLAAPLAWFFLGRELLDRRTAAVLIYLTIALGVAAGFYGLWQTEIGLPPWDAAWVEINGFAALNVGGEIRAVASFSNAIEYARYLSMGVVFVIALAMHRRAAALVALPVLLVALFFSAVRSALASAAGAAIIMLALRSRRGGAATALALLGIAGGIASLTLAGPALDRVAAKSSNPFVKHQVGGIARPLDEESSTGPDHLRQVRDALVAGIQQPLGQGTVTVGIPGNRFQGEDAAGGAETDFAIGFVSLGLLGGLLFIAILIIAFRETILAYFQRGDHLLLAVVGMLFVDFNGWLAGAQYAVAPLFWCLLGWATSEAHRPPLGQSQPENLP